MNTEEVFKQLNVALQGTSRAIVVLSDGSTPEVLITGKEYEPTYTSNALEGEIYSGLGTLVEDLFEVIESEELMVESVKEK